MVEEKMNDLAALRQHIRDSDMALRAEEYKQGYLHARLDVEKEIIPDEALLALGMEAMDKRASAIQAEQQAARTQILKFQQAVEEELYESDSDQDEESLGAMSC